MKSKDLVSLVADTSKTAYCSASDFAVNTAGFLVFTSPLYAVIEKLGYGMTDNESIDLRTGAAILAVFGAAHVYQKGRDLTNRVIDYKLKKKNDTFNDDSRSIKKRDFWYSTAFGAVFNAAILTYSAFNNQETFKWSNSLIALGIGTALSGPSGVIGAYGIDLMRDLTDLRKRDNKKLVEKGLPEKVSRSPKFIRNFTKKSKLVIATVTIAASLMGMTALYKTVPDNFPGVKGCIEQGYEYMTK